MAELDEEAVVANQQKQIQLPADWKALHVYLDKQCPLQPVPASRCCKSAPEERFDGRPIEEYLVPWVRNYALSLVEGGGRRGGRCGEAKS